MVIINKILDVTNLNFSWGSNEVLKDISFSMKSNEVVAILGINGAGKSTLIKCLNRILSPKSGDIHIRPHWSNLKETNLINISSLDLVEISKTMSYVPQNVATSFPMDVFDVVLLGRKPHLSWRISDEDRDKVSETLRYLNLEDFAFRKFNQISGGERQRVIIAKAIAQDPNLFLFDEPTSDLDLKNQIQIMKCIRKIIKDKNNSKSALIAIHDINIAAKYSDKILLLNNGSIMAYGPPSQVLTEENIAEVFGVKCSISSVDKHYIRVDVDDEI
ncbi:MAG: ABC transporter ATP-binding protein [Methanobacteriota archaeon]|nr:MAG: ABC transporter ATP-binding protein [Euryarchaeota archaeon]